MAKDRDRLAVPLWSLLGPILDINSWGNVDQKDISWRQCCDTRGAPLEVVKIAIGMETLLWKYRQKGGSFDPLRIPDKGT